MKPLVAIAGATSKQGRSVATTLLRSGQYRVRALTRNPAAPQAQALARLGAEVVAAPLAVGHDAAWCAAFRGADSAFLMTPPTLPNDSDEFPLGCALAEAAVAAGVPYLIFSTLENVDAISAGRHYAPHFTDKARIADHIRGLPVAHSFIMLAFFYTNLLEYYIPRREGDTLLLPIYLPEDYRAPFVDPLTATGPAIAEILARPAQYQGQTLPVIGDILSPRDIVATFSRATGSPRMWSAMRALSVKCGAYLSPWLMAATFSSVLKMRCGTPAATAVSASAQPRANSSESFGGVGGVMRKALSAPRKAARQAAS